MTGDDSRFKSRWLEFVVVCCFGEEGGEGEGGASLQAPSNKADDANLPETATRTWGGGRRMRAIGYPLGPDGFPR